jgi:hypothetical protein
MKKLLQIISTYIAFYTLTVNKAYAAACYGSLGGVVDGVAPTPFGAGLKCVLENVWGFMSKIFVAIAIIMTMFLIFKTVTSRENEKELAEIPKKWMYMIIFVLLSFGAGGTVLDFTLRLFGFGGVDSWLLPLNRVFDAMDRIANP